ncbi:MAG: GH116 family glycosyl hydrolase, partial [Bianqueaceae bacterium]
GSCTHVWNYAQAICNLFPSLERTLRETEFLVSQDEHGHQNFRSSLPIRPCRHDFYAASDGQLGGLIKLYRDYTICGDLEWLTKLWPAAKQSMEYCIATWDPDEEGLLREPHHNTYDIDFGDRTACAVLSTLARWLPWRPTAALGERGRYTALREKEGRKCNRAL